MSDPKPISETLQPIAGLGAVILAGGKSTRLGQNKMELAFQKSTFLEGVCHRVAQVCSPIVIVGKIDPAKHDLPANVILTNDEEIDKGPLEGMRVGLKTLAEHAGGSVEFAFVTSCDVPLLKPELIRFLYSQLNESGAVVPVDGDRIYGMTAIYRSSFFSIAAERIANKKLRVSELAKACSANMIELEKLKVIDPELDSLTNINSMDDYRKLLAKTSE